MAPNPNDPVLANLQAAKGQVATRYQGALDEISRRQAEADSLVGAIPGQLSSIYGTADKSMQQTSEALRNSFAANNIGNYAPADSVLSHLQTASAQQQAGSQASVPLLQSGIRDTFSRQSGGLDQMRLSELSDIDAREAGYLGQLEAEERRVRIDRENALAQAAYDAQQSLLARQFQGEQAGLDRAFSASESAKARAASLAGSRSSGGSGGGSYGGSSLSDSELRTRLIGAGQAALAAGDYPTTAVKPSGPQSLTVLGKTVTGPSVPVTTKLPVPTAEALARQIGVQSGLDPSVVYGLVQDPKAKPPPTGVVSTDHRNNTISRVGTSASPGTYAAFLKTVANANDLDAALALVNARTDAELKAAGVGKTSLINWLRDYYSKG